MAIKMFLNCIVLAIFMFCFSLSASAEVVPMATVKQLIVKHSIEMGLDPALALSIAKAESNFCQHKKSRYGAIGVFQLMPSTAKKMGYNPYHIHENIKGGIAYYKLMFKMFGTTELALAAYNAGPGNVKKYKGIPPFNETRKFVSSIITNYNNLKKNPDPVIANYQNNIKEISYVQEDKEKDFREKQDAILYLYLSEQGI